MERAKRILWKALHPGIGLTILLVLVSAAGLCYVFLKGMEQHPLAYALYPISAYALCVAVAAALPLVKRVRKAVYSNQRAALYLTHAELRARISLYTGTLINLGYALFKLVTGIWFRSFWLGAVAVYYMVLCLIRFLLVRNDRKSRVMDGGREQLVQQWKSYRLCGWLLLALNAAISGMVFQMIWQNRSYSYPGFVIYASAAYTFYRLTMSIIRAVKSRKGEQPVFAAARALDLCVALMAIFALQTALLDTFGSELSEWARLVLNTFTGGSVCLAVVCIALYMILRSGKVLREKEKN